MNKELGISTGIFYKFYEEEELNRKISHIFRWDIDRVEILFSRLFMLDIPLSEENKTFLKKKKVTLHAPFFNNEGYDFCKLSKEEIKKLVKIGKEINAEYIIVHPDLLEDVEILKEFDFPFVFENVKKEINEEFCLENLEKCFKLNPNLGLALDLSHAGSLSNEKIKGYIKKYCNLKEIHISIKEQTSFLEGERQNFQDFLDQEVNFILESRPRSMDKMHLIIKRLKEILN